MTTAKTQTIDRQHKNFEQLLSTIIYWMLHEECEIEDIEAFKDSVQSITRTEDGKIILKHDETTRIKTTED